MALAEYGNALNIDTDGSGNPILVDPQSGDVIAIYDRASGAWQVTEIEATTGDFDSVNTDAATIENIQITQDNIGSLTKYSGNSISPGSSDEFLVVFDLASPVDILSGAIIGPLITQIRFTWDDGTADVIGSRNFGNGQTTSTSAGGDAHRHEISPVSVPPANGVTKLEFRIEEQAEYGFEVYST